MQNVGEYAEPSVPLPPVAGKALAVVGGSESFECQK